MPSDVLLEREELTQEFQEAASDKERTAEIELWDTLIDEELNQQFSLNTLSVSRMLLNKKTRSA